ncbi:MAG: homocysteine S-methyltransferase family protein, partial [Planctomycetota bacterium]
PLGFWPSASTDGSAGDPLAFAQSVAESTRRFDLRAVGGCCGSGPAHIRHLATELGLGGPEDDWYDEVEKEDVDDSDEE